MNEGHRAVGWLRSPGACLVHDQNQMELQRSAELCWVSTLAESIRFTLRESAEMNAVMCLIMAAL